MEIAWTQGIENIYNLITNITHMKLDFYSGNYHILFKFRDYEDYAYFHSPDRKEVELMYELISSLIYR